METSELLFEHKKPIPEKLAVFGFQRNDKNFIYRVLLPSTRLELTVTVNLQGTVQSKILDKKTNSPYILHLTGGEGKFVGRIRTEYEALLHKIAVECFERQVFKTEQAQQILTHAQKQYGNEPEYLWKQFPDYAVLRRTDNAKWYAVILQIPPVKLGLPPGPRLEVLDLRAEPEDLERLLDGKNYFPGYHMNKKHWVTLCLDGRMKTEEILQHLDKSWLLAHQ